MIYCNDSTLQCVSLLFQSSKKGFDVFLDRYSPNYHYRCDFHATRRLSKQWMFTLTTWTYVPIQTLLSMEKHSLFLTFRAWGIVLTCYSIAFKGCTSNLLPAVWIFQQMPQVWKNKSPSCHRWHIENVKRADCDSTKLFVAALKLVPSGLTFSANISDYVIIKRLLLTALSSWALITLLFMLRGTSWGDLVVKSSATRRNLSWRSLERVLLSATQLTALLYQCQNRCCVLWCAINGNWDHLSLFTCHVITFSCNLSGIYVFVVEIHNLKGQLGIF